MPEACFFCLDSTEYMRNGDQFPNRSLAQQEAANLLANAKTQMNAENMVGFLTMGGAACTVYETLTSDVERVTATLTKVKLGGKVCHFSHGLLIASLALSHRTNPRAEKRIVAFVGTPILATEKDLETLAKRLRKDDVAVDVVLFGVPDNQALLEAFVSKVNKQGNSRFLNVPDNISLTDALMSSPILLNEAAMGMEDGGAAPMQTNYGFSVDPNLDPELAMAIRMSMEEEERRQAALASAAAANQQENPQPTGNQTPANEEDIFSMSEEEMLQRALQLSLETAQPQGDNSNTNEKNDDEEKGNGN